MDIFFHRQLLRTKQRAWGAAGLFAFFILATASFALTVSRWLQSYHLLGISLAGLLLLLLFYLVAYFVSLRIRNIRAYLDLTILLFVAALLMQAMVSTAEKVHLLEYALLALLFFKACQFHHQGGVEKGGLYGYGIPLLLTMGVNWLDEIWQGVLPERVYDIQDILFNTCGGILGIGVAWIRRRYTP